MKSRKDTVSEGRHREGKRIEKSEACIDALSQLAICGVGSTKLHMEIRYRFG
jgi:hypothetical protein